METPAPVVMGKIVGVHGVRGNLKMISFAESTDLFRAGSCVLLKTTGGHERRVTVNWAKPHNRFVLVSLWGVDSRERADTLVGAELLCPRDRLPPLEDGTYYWCDLIGLRVVDATGGALGRVHHVLPTGANDVLVVRRGRTERLVPAVEPVVREVDTRAGVIRVDLPDGL